MPGPSIDTVIIFSPRMEELAEFYRKGLDLPEPTRHGKDHLGFSLQGVYLGFDRASETRPGSNITAWFRVDDVQATFDRLIELGAKPKSGPTRKPWGDVLAAVFDPDGNLIGLSKRRED